MWTYVGVVAFAGALPRDARACCGDPQFDTVAALADPFGLVGAERGDQVLDRGRAQHAAAADDRPAARQPRCCGSAVGARAVRDRVSPLPLRAAGGRANGRAPSAADERPRRRGEPAAPAPRPTRPTPPRWTQLWRSRALRHGVRVPQPGVLRAARRSACINAGLGTAGSPADGTAARRTPGHPRRWSRRSTGSFTLFPIIIAIYYAGELVWRDRERRIHEIVDATAAPDWAFLVPKIVAITLVLLRRPLVAAVLTGIAVQLLKRLHPLRARRATCSGSCCRC